MKNLNFHAGGAFSDQQSCQKAAEKKSAIKIEKKWHQNIISRFMHLILPTLDKDGKLY